MVAHLLFHGRVTPFCDSVFQYNMNKILWFVPKKGWNTGCIHVVLNELWAVFMHFCIRIHTLLGRSDLVSGPPPFSIVGLHPFLTQVSSTT